MIDAIASWYPGHRVLEFFVVVAAAVTMITAVAWAVACCLGRQPATRHGVLLSALAASIASPLFAWGFIASGRSFVSVPLLVANETASPTARLVDQVKPIGDASGTRGQGHVHDGLSPGPGARQPSNENDLIGQAKLGKADRAGRPAHLLRAAALTGPADMVVRRLDCDAWVPPKLAVRISTPPFRTTDFRSGDEGHSSRSQTTIGCPGFADGRCLHAGTSAAGGRFVSANCCAAAITNRLD